MEEALDALPDNPTYEDYIKFAETADLEDPQHVYTGDNEVNLLSTRVSSPYWSSSTKGVRTVYEADGTVFLNEAVKVIDVSKWQGDIDWDAVAKTDVDAVILRIGYGVGYTDAKFERNLAACQRLGIPFGVYTYSYAYDGNVATEEAQWIIQLFNKYGLDKDTPVFYDLEQWTMTGHTPPTSPAVYDTIVNNFFNTLSASGFTNVHVYSYYSYLNGPLKSQNIWSKTSWVARYNGYLGFDIQSPSGMKGWQYSSSGSVSGISGNVDMNAFAATEDWLSGKWIYENGNYYYQNGDGSLAG